MESPALSTRQEISHIRSHLSPPRGHALICHLQGRLGRRMFISVRLKCANVCVAEVKWNLLSRVRLFATPWTVQPARFLCLWDSPGKDPGVGCHSLLQRLPFPSSFVLLLSCYYRGAQQEFQAAQPASQVSWFIFQHEDPQASGRRK